MAKLKKYCKFLCIFSWEVYASIGAKRGKKAISQVQNSLQSEERKGKKNKEKTEMFIMNRNFTDTAFVSGCQSLVFSVHI